MKKLAVEQAVGMALCHDITQVKDGFKGAVFKRGHIIRPEDIDTLLDVGKRTVFVWEDNANEVHEEDAALRMAAMAPVEHAYYSELSEGKVTLIARRRGMFRVNKELLRQNTNLVPFYTTKNYLHVLKYSTDRYMRTHCFMNLSGNIVLFIPAGWLLPRLWGWLQNFFRFFAFCAGLIFLVETVQLFTLLGRFDIDDLILNLSGMILGFILFHLGQPR